MADAFSSFFYHICLHRDVTAIVKDFLFNVCQLNDFIRHVPILVFLTLYLFLEARTVKYRSEKKFDIMSNEVTLHRC